MASASASVDGQNHGLVHWSRLDAADRRLGSLLSAQNSSFCMGAATFGAGCPAISSAG